MEEKETQRAIYEAEIRCLMSDLSANTSDIGDYKIIKIIEANLKGEEPPYDFNELNAKRQKARDRINELQQLLAELD